ncbi:hypothetical protein FTE28_17835 [Bacillus licheniformis]|uniref:hypothetical protein n=1 Tax=Bacillus TaxID=1386 RepID=UPI0011A383B7|nr:MULTISPECIES: hypothetical protein [Bacillus]MCY7913246.1 hypothetical protein [Bacillus haynesii]MCY7927622.1 hypothetical protein [Bacillus haynesii]MCY8539745.1 hypothetical protein [Bacillus haynesii]MCY8773536.1 hypothetical protein [Bacillus haynesii]MCY9152512.1 hypothetical protein [Bacillus haynesii]
MLKKKVIASSLVFTMLLSTAPIASFAAEKESSKRQDVSYVQVQKTALQTMAETKNQTVVKTSGEYTTQGLKKDALVWALRHGGNLVGDLLSNLSKKNANYVKKYSKQIADFLDSVSNSIEARLIDFMIFELGIPASSARTIAWAIMLIIG